MFYICVVQYDNHYPHVAAEALQVCLGDWETKFLI